MYALLLVIHVIICLFLMAAVLLQSGRGGSLASAFGVGGGSQTLFGGRGASTFLTTATQVLGAALFVTSFSLAILSRQSSTPRSLIQRQSGRLPAASPGQAAPGQTPASQAPAAQAPAPSAQTSGAAPGGK